MAATPAPMRATQSIQELPPNDTWWCCTILKRSNLQSRQTPLICRMMKVRCRWFSDYCDSHFDKTVKFPVWKFRQREISLRQGAPCCLGCRWQILPVAVRPLAWYLLIALRSSEYMNACIPTHFSLKKKIKRQSGNWVFFLFCSTSFCPMCSELERCQQTWPPFSLSIGLLCLVLYFFLKHLKCCKGTSICNNTNSISRDQFLCSQLQQQSYLHYKIFAGPKIFVKKVWL